MADTSGWQKVAGARPRAPHRIGRRWLTSNEQNQLQRGLDEAASGDERRLVAFLRALGVEDVWDLGEQDNYYEEE